MMDNKEIEYTARPIPGGYEGRSHRACVWYNRARYGISTAGLEPVTISQRRTFTNFGVRMEVHA